MAGAWWPEDYDGPALVSFDSEIAKSLGLAVGDSIAVNVLGRTIEAKIANLRFIEWRNLGINFVMVFSPNTFRGAPHTVLATLALAPGATAADEAALLKAAAAAYPTVTSVRVKDALQAIDDVVSQLAIAIQAASSVALFASLLVLAGALAAGHRARLYDAVVLKTLGATRWRLLAAYGLEYGALGAATAVFGIVAGASAAMLVVTRVMNLPFTISLGGPLAAAALAVLRHGRAWPFGHLAHPGAETGRLLTKSLGSRPLSGSLVGNRCQASYYAGCVGCPAPRGNQRGFPCPTGIAGCSA